MQKLYQLVRSVLVGGRADEHRGQSRVRYAAQLVCRTRQGRFPARLVDLAAEGLRLKTTAALKPGQRVSVSAPASTGWMGRQRLRCQVAWAVTRKVTEAGLVYQDTPQNLALSWVQMALNQISPEEGDRRARRVPVDLLVNLYDQEGLVQKARCLDLGPGGAFLVCLRPLPLGTPAMLQVGKAVLAARVVRCDDEGGEYCLRLRFSPGANRNQQGLKELLVEMLGDLDDLPDLTDVRA